MKEIRTRYRAPLRPSLGLWAAAALVFAAGLAWWLWWAADER
jgi:hypothetical protein